MMTVYPLPTSETADTGSCKQNTTSGKGADVPPRAHECGKTQECIMRSRVAERSPTIPMDHLFCRDAAHRTEMAQRIANRDKGERRNVAWQPKHPLEVIFQKKMPHGQRSAQAQCTSRQQQVLHTRVAARRLS